MSCSRCCKCRWSRVLECKRWTITAPQQNNLPMITLICQANHVNSNFVTIRRATPPQSSSAPRPATPAGMTRACINIRARACQSSNMLRSSSCTLSCQSSNLAPLAHNIPERSASHHFHHPPSSACEMATIRSALSSQAIALL